MINKHECSELLNRINYIHTFIEGRESILGDDISQDGLVWLSKSDGSAFLFGKILCDHVLLPVLCNDGRIVCMESTTSRIVLFIDFHHNVIHSSSLEIHSSIGMIIQIMMDTLGRLLILVPSLQKHLWVCVCVCVCVY